jgi:hypothetical protein
MSDGLNYSLVPFLIPAAFLFFGMGLKYYLAELLKKKTVKSYSALVVALCTKIRISYHAHGSLIS